MEPIKNFRLNHGYTRKQMANLLNVSISQYDKIEFNQRSPSNAFLKKFKRAFPEFDMNIFFEPQSHIQCKDT